MEPAPVDPIHRLFLRHGWPTPQLILLALLAVGFSITPLVSAATHPDRNKDYPLWFLMGTFVRDGQPLYPEGTADEFPYMYPPTTAVFLFAPLTHLGPVGFVAVCCAVNATAWLGCLLLAANLATVWRKPIHPLVYVIPALATVAYVYDSFLLGQINVVLMCLVLASARCIRTGWNIPAGVLLGVAAAIKVFPLPIVAYFIVRRKWTASATTLLTIATVWFLLPAPLRGFERNLHEMKVWAVGMLGDQSGASVAQRSETGFTFHNQGVVSVVHRLMRPVNAGSDSHVITVNLADASAGTAQAMGIGIGVALGVVILVAGRGRFARTPTAELAEWGMAYTLAVLCSPLAWTYFFAWLLPAWVAVTSFLIDPEVARKKKTLVAGTAASAALLLFSALSEQFDPTLQACGATCWGGVLLFLACGAVVRYEGSLKANGERTVRTQIAIGMRARSLLWFPGRIATHSVTRS